ncbi:unnamed protein product, partial [Nesidiocoris tenuis]
MNYCRPRKSLRPCPLASIYVINDFVLVGCREVRSGGGGWKVVHKLGSVKRHGEAWGHMPLSWPILLYPVRESFWNWSEICVPAILLRLLDLELTNQVWHTWN